jgi:hypothetical protein
MALSQTALVHGSHEAPCTLIHGINDHGPDVLFIWTIGPHISDMGSHYETTALSSNHNENMLQLIAGQLG